MKIAVIAGGEHPNEDVSLARTKGLGALQSRHVHVARPGRYLSPGRAGANPDLCYLPCT